MNALELAKILKATLVGTQKSDIKGFSIDSRKVKEGDVFIALKGERHDGHDFVKEALSRGAVGAVVEKEVSASGGFLLRVPSTLDALRKIGRYKRSKFKGTVIGVAGSAGKTTTKDLIHHLLSETGKSYKSAGNLNSKIGLPLVLANMPQDADYAVLELGASAVGDVLELTRLAKPKVRVITSIGEEHLETFGTVEDVIRGNGEIFYGFGNEDWAVIPAHLKGVYGLPEDRVITFGTGGNLEAQDVRISQKGTLFKFMGKEVLVPVLSMGVVDNVLASFGVLTALGYDPLDFTEALGSFKPPEGRMNLIDLGEVILIDDTYNANPPSVRNALRTLSSLETGGKRIAVLGDMLELGDQSEKLHREVGKLIAEMGIDFAIFYGNHMRFAYEECVRRGGNCLFLKEDSEVLEVLLKWLENRNIILIKGSRGMKMERFTSSLRGLIKYEL